MWRLCDGYFTWQRSAPRTVPNPSRGRHGIPRRHLLIRPMIITHKPSRVTEVRSDWWPFGTGSGRRRVCGVCGAGHEQGVCAVGVIIFIFMVDVVGPGVKRVKTAPDTLTGLFDGYLTVIWQLFDSYLTVIWQLFDSYLKAIWRLLTVIDGYWRLLYGVLGGWFNSYFTVTWRLLDH